MTKITELPDNTPHSVSEVICVECKRRWIAIYPTETLLKDLECPNSHIGFVIKTGQVLEAEHD